MRLYLLPISTRRTLLYCQRLNTPATTTNQTWMDKIQTKAAKTWADWEKKDKGWQKRVVSYGNYAFRRIPYEEWGLKSVPPLRRDTELEGSEKAEVVYPQSLITGDRVPQILKRLATEREGLHKRRLIWCFIGMPITAPIALIPLIPNLPFFYLVYRAWSHWRALAGGRHIQFLLQNNLLTLRPSPILDEVYAKQRHPLPSTPKTTTAPDAYRLASLPRLAEKETINPDGEEMLLSQENAKKMAQALDIPQLEVELERAIWQVETAIQKRNAELASGDGGKQQGSSDEAASQDEKKSQ